MERLNPQNLESLAQVSKYWQQCLADKENGEDERETAAHIVGVMSNNKDEEWSSGSQSHPAYNIIFELAASLELPEGTPEYRQAQWSCVNALLPLIPHD